MTTPNSECCGDWRCKWHDCSEEDRCSGCAGRGACGEVISLREQEIKRQERNRKARVSRKARHELMLDCGLVKGRDSMGRVIYE